jgi:hypothetical protein
MKRRRGRRDASHEYATAPTTEAAADAVQSHASCSSFRIPISSRYGLIRL